MLLLVSMKRELGGSMKTGWCDVIPFGHSICSRHYLYLCGIFAHLRSYLDHHHQYIIQSLSHTHTHTHTHTHIVPCSTIGWYHAMFNETYMIIVVTLVMLHCLCIPTHWRWVKRCFCCNVEFPPFLRLRELLTTVGDRFTDGEVDMMLKDAPVDNSGNFDYNVFTTMLKHGKKDD